MVSITRNFNAYLDHMKSITILLPKAYYNGESSHFELMKNGKNEPLIIKEKIILADQIKYICQCKSDPVIGQVYWVMDERGEKTDLQIGAVIRTEDFDKHFYYEGRLGITYEKQKTIFKVWAPTAIMVKLKLYKDENSVLEPLEMIREEKGVWSIEVKGNLEYFQYSFLVCVNFQWREAVDPYAVSVTANGKLGVIIDLNKTKLDLKIPSAPMGNTVNAIIYETHIRDFTIHRNSGVKEKGTYLGAAELGTTGKTGAITGLSYVRDLGVTHIQLLPLHDYEGVDELGEKTDYNWGYNPIHFNAPDGSYSSNPKDPYARIIELKKLIASVHSQGLRVIMDVVYNHVYSRENSSFESIVPGYYFRFDENGMPSNGTGVGNDIASERRMVRKFIVDSVMYWKKQYGVDGFRFDLMGILDIETMNTIRRELNKLNSNTIIIGEGWDLQTPIPPELKANIGNQKRLPGIGQFNDRFRDSIKGSTFNLQEGGYVTGNKERYEAVKEVIAGSIGLENGIKGLFSEPCQTVNYVESHDNHTLWDKLELCLPEESVEVRKRRQRLATVIVLLSQGIPFLHSGQEFFRTKKGDGNSYQSPDQINEINWDAMADNKGHVDYIKGIIEIRKAHHAFRLPNAELIRKHMRFLKTPRPVVGYWLKEVGEYGVWKEIIVLFNPTQEIIFINLPYSDWKVLANDSVSGAQPIGTQFENIFSLKPCSSYVLVK